jgi:hypothetical protein
MAAHAAAIAAQLVIAMFVDLMIPSFGHGDCDLIRQTSLPGQERRSFVVRLARMTRETPGREAEIIWGVTEVPYL